MAEGERGELYYEDEYPEWVVCEYNSGNRHKEETNGFVSESGHEWGVIKN